MAAQEPLAGVLNTLHNLAFYLETMRKVREEIAAEAVSQEPGPDGHDRGGQGVGESIKR